MSNDIDHHCFVWIIVVNILWGPCIVIKNNQKHLHKRGMHWLQIGVKHLDTLYTNGIAYKQLKIIERI